MLFDPSNGNIAYATLGGVYKSTDGGNTWASANGTGANTLPAGSYYGLAIAPSSPQTLFVDTPDYGQRPDVQKRGRGTKLDSLAGFAAVRGDSSGPG